MLAKKRAKVTTGKNCIRNFYTFSPLETPFGLRKLRHVVLPRPLGEVPRRGGEGVGCDVLDAP